jgi:hypothetical protein
MVVFRFTSTNSASTPYQQKSFEDYTLLLVQRASGATRYGKFLQLQKEIKSAAKE